MSPWAWVGGAGLLLLIGAAVGVVRWRRRGITSTASPQPAKTTAKHPPQSAPKKKVTASHAARKGMTLLEVLVTIAIIAILVGLGVMGVQKVRAAAARAQCINQLKQLGLGCHAAHDVHKRMPPAFGFFPGDGIYGGGNGLGNLFFHLLPHVDQKALYLQARHRPRSNPQQDYFFYTANGVHQTLVPLFNCPSDPSLVPGVDPAVGYAPSSYAGNYLVFGTVDARKASKNAQGEPRMPGSFPDGTSNTILFAEKYASAWIPSPPTPVAGGEGRLVGGCYWAYFQEDCNNPFFAYHAPARGGRPSRTDPGAVEPGPFQVQPRAAGGCNPCLPATGHTVLNVCLGDGSVRGLSSGMADVAWWALVTPNAGDRGGED